jgi:hypothetical protein
MLFLHLFLYLHLFDEYRPNKPGYHNSNYEDLFSLDLYESFDVRHLHDTALFGIWLQREQAT